MSANSMKDLLLVALVVAVIVLSSRTHKHDEAVEAPLPATEHGLVDDCPQVPEMYARNDCRDFIGTDEFQDCFTESLEAWEATLATED